MKLFKNRTILGIFCIAVSLLICFAATPLVNAGLSKKATIVRFVKPVKEGEEIKRNMLQEVEVGGYNLPENVIRSITDAEGKYLKADVCVGDYLVAEKVSVEPAAENKYQFVCGRAFGKTKKWGHCRCHRARLSWKRRDGDS